MIMRLGGCILILTILVISFSLWIFVLEHASKGFFELWVPLGYIFIFVYIGLTIAAIVKWQDYSFERRHYITVQLRVTDEQRKALVDHTIALGYGEMYKGHQEKYKGHQTYTDSDLQFCIRDLLELELRERLPEMLAKHAARRARIMSEMSERQAEKQT